MMRKLEHAFERRPRAHWSGWLLLLAGCAALGVAWVDRSRRIDALDALRVQVRQLQATLAERDRSRSNTPLSDREADLHARQQHALLRLHLPWARLLRAVEHTSNLSIRLASIRPDTAEGTVELSGHAATLQEAAGYLEQLQRTEMTNVRMVSTEVDQSQAQMPVAFAIKAHWNRPLSGS